MAEGKVARVTLTLEDFKELVEGRAVEKQGAAIILEDAPVDAVVDVVLGWRRRFLRAQQWNIAWDGRAWPDG